MIEAIFSAIMTFLLAETGGVPPAWTMHVIPLSVEIAKAAHDHPLSGPDGERHMASILTALSLLESRARPSAVGDHGASLGAFQISRSWPAHDARQASLLVLESFRVCRAQPLANRLSWYANGGSSCPPSPASSRRMALAGRILPTLP